MTRKASIGRWPKPAVLFLALIFALSAVIPISVQAAEGDPTEVSSAADLRTALTAGGDIKLTGDITGGPFIVPEGKEVTIDLNGYTIDRNLTSAAGNGYVISVAGTLTVTDTSSGQVGKITGGWNSNGFGGAIDVNRDASFTLAGGSVTGNVVSHMEGFGGGVFVDNGATFTMTGGEISYCSAGSNGISSNGYGGAVAVYGTFDMKGGYIYECGILNSKLSSTAYGGAVAVAEGGTFILDGGEIGKDKAGNLHGNQANQQGGAVYVQKREDNYPENSSKVNTFEFKSGTITVSSASGGAAGAVYDGDTFTMTGGTIEQTPSGPAVVVDSSGTFTMSSGAIQKNSATGVVVNSGGTFTMSGGGISENIGAFGGGVRVNGGEFNLSGGAIVDNTANSAGGGVYISPDNSGYGLVNGGTFNMTSGTIAQNKVTGFHNTASIGYGNGGGVWVGNGAFNLSGGIIVNNQSALVEDSGGHASLGGGVWVGNNGSFTVTGAPAIQDNKVGNSSFKSNVKLDSNARISIDSNLNNARIGVTPFVSVGSDWGSNAVDIFQFNQGANDNIFSDAAVSEDKLRNFSSDVEDYKVVLHDSDDHAQLLYHAHTITYTAEGNTLTAKCTGCDEKAELMLFVYDNLVDNSSVKAYFGSPGLNAINALTKKSISQGDIEYYEDNTKLDHMPTTAGTYIARFTLTDNGTDYIIEKEFTIGHDWEEWEVVTEPTFDTTGEERRVCSNCGETETKQLDKLPSVTVTVVGSTIDDAEVAENYTIRVAPGTTLQSIGRSDGASIISHFTKTDEGYIPFEGRSWITTKPMSELGSWSDVYADYQTNVTKPINDDTTLYLAIAKTVDTIELSAKAPVCGTEVVYDYNGTNTGKPVITLKENGQVATPSNAGFARGYPHWVDEDEDPIESATIKGGDTYTAFAMVDPAFGYQFVDGAEITLSVDGAVTGTAQIVEESLAPDYPEYMQFKFDVTAIHDAYKGVVTIQPTCTTPGTRTIYCKHNGESWHGDDVILSEEAIPINPDAHDYDEGRVSTEPTCTENGVKTYVCKHNENHTKTEEIEALGHSWGDWEVTTEATETEEGEETRTCTRCDETESRIIPVKDHEHKLAKVDAREATCTEAGNIEYWVCSEGDNPCGHYFADEDALTEIDLEDTIIPATGHDWSDWEETTAPTCTEAGIETRVCTHDSDHKETREGSPALGHDWGEWEETTAPTCTEAGVETRVCVHDSNHQETREIAALEHDFGEWIVTKEATETEEGEEMRTCAHCGETETQVIPKIEPVDEPIHYYNSAGNELVWVKGSDITADFTFKRSAHDEETFSHFMGIQVDAKDVDQEQYTSESGSVIIRLSPEYMETLELGRHQITAFFDDGNSVSADFTVTKNEEPRQKKSTTPSNSGNGSKQTAPKTGDVSDTALWIMLLGISMTCLLITRFRKHKKNG